MCENGCVYETGLLGYVLDLRPRYCSDNTGDILEGRDKTRGQEIKKRNVEHGASLEHHYSSLPPHSQREPSPKLVSLAMSGQQSRIVRFHS